MSDLRQHDIPVAMAYTENQESRNVGRIMKEGPIQWLIPYNIQ